MSLMTIAPSDDVHAERWQRWQQAYGESSRKTEMRVRIVFTVILTVLSGWLALQLLRAWA